MSIWKLVLLSAVLARSALSIESRASTSPLAHTEWHRFLSDYSRSYASDEEHDARYAIFRDNLEFIRQHNAKAKLGLETYWVAINEFADMSNTEFASRLSLRPSASRSSKQHRLFRAVTNETVPASVDWRQKGLITAIKNQGKCGSCWSFASTGSMEGAYALAHQANQSGALTEFSEQELIDCVHGGEFTCTEGGEYTDAFAFVIANGTVTENQYGYVSGGDQDVEQCRLKQMSQLKGFAKYVTLQSGDENALQVAVAERPGVAVAIDASHIGFQFYFHGVYKPRHCSTTELDHAVLVVGYDTDRHGGDYWIVKNSWGESWGQHGYIWMARNRNNLCGIATQPAYILTREQVDPALHISVM